MSDHGLSLWKGDQLDVHPRSATSFQVRSWGHRGRDILAKKSKFRAAAEALSQTLHQAIWAPKWDDDPRAPQIRQDSIDNYEEIVATLWSLGFNVVRRRKIKEVGDDGQKAA